MVSGVAFPQPFALAMLPMGQWATLKTGGRDEFTTELAAHIKAVNAQLDPHERLDFVVVVSEQWTVEEGFITPTLKLKRNVLEKHYGPHFDKWAAVRKPVVWHEA